MTTGKEENDFSVLQCDRGRKRGFPDLNEWMVVNWRIGLHRRLSVCNNRSVAF